MKKSDNKEAEYEKMLEEAAVDCYGEEEELMGVLYTLQDKLKFPFDAIVLEKPAKILDIDDNKSGLRAGIMMKARIEGIGKMQSVALFMVEAEDKDSTNEKWLEWAKWWARRG